MAKAVQVVRVSSLDAPPRTTSFNTNANKFPRRRLLHSCFAQVFLGSGFANDAIHVGTRVGGRRMCPPSRGCFGSWGAVGHGSSHRPSLVVPSQNTAPPQHPAFSCPRRLDFAVGSTRICGCHHRSHAASSTLLLPQAATSRARGDLFAVHRHGPPKGAVKQ